MFQVKLLEPDQWAKLREEAHLIAFGRHRTGDLDRADFALLAVDHDSEPAGYVSCIEMDQETIYWQFGGAFPNHKGTVNSFQGYSELIDWCGQHFRRITTKIENTNKVMIKFALKAGFLIVGTSVFKDKIYVELMKEF